MHSSSTHIDYPFILLSQRRNTLELYLVLAGLTSISQMEGSEVLHCIRRDSCEMPSSIKGVQRYTVLNEISSSQR